MLKNRKKIIIHKEGCSAIRCCCGKLKDQEEIILEIQEKASEAEHHRMKITDDYGCA